MRIYLLGSGRLVERDETMQEIVASSIVVITASVVGKVVT